MVGPIPHEWPLDRIKDRQGKDTRKRERLDTRSQQVYPTLVHATECIGALAGTQLCAGDTLRGWLGRFATGLGEHPLQFVHELIEIFELAVHRSEADIGHFVQSLQLFHYGLAD